jgi:hypothetical protein
MRTLCKCGKIFNAVRHKYYNECLTCREEKDKELRRKYNIQPQKDERRRYARV